jgi:peptide/nickel transport system ATP-binding protein
VSPSATTLEKSPAGGAATGDPLLVVKDLRVHFPTSDGVVKAVDGLSYTVERGKTLGIVGESGSGKSVSSSAIMGLFHGTNAQLSGQILLDGTDILALSENEMRKLRGRDVAMIFQDPLSALHPYYTVGAQIIEAYQVHSNVPKKVARRRAIELLDRVGIPQPDRRVDDYPHQFSGGMRQRAMIAMGLINDPSMLIADEPTTALDVTVQAQILDLLQDLQKEFNSAVIIITHDLGVVAEMTDDTLVMYGGRAVEYGRTSEILTHPEMPYTWGLLSSVPDVTGDTSAKLIPIPGNPPSLLNPPSGCHFHPRCAHRDKVAGDLCRTTTPELVPGVRGSSHLKRCHLPDPETIYMTEVLPEIAPDLVDELAERVEEPAEEQAR